MFDKMKSSAESYGVIGLGRFGTALVKTLSDAGKEVIAVDKDEAKVKAVRGWTDYAFVIDELNEAALKETGMQNCGTVTICIGERIDISILTTMLVTKLGVPHVISKAASEVHGEVLKQLGAEVVYPEADMAVRIGKRLISGNLLDYVALGDGVEVRRIAVGGKMQGKSVRELDLRKVYGINVIAVEHARQTNVEFSADYTFKDGDVMAVVGKVAKIDRFEKEMCGAAHRARQWLKPLRPRKLGQLPTLWGAFCAGTARVKSLLALRGGGRASAKAGGAFLPSHYNRPSLLLKN